MADHFIRKTFMPVMPHQHPCHPRHVAMADIDHKVKTVTNVSARVDGPIFTEEMSGPTDAIAQANEPVMHKRRSTGAQA